ncbi:tripartite tricarboxylate transporter substrate binding protein [Paenibacillus filicis]|uniref:Tripartite tricarboxylate transporter substrate binding protein n=1 Tax=Paenibacillus filicis TaxID=669464 RepID=A0ABU9DCH5_9BACL
MMKKGKLLTASLLAFTVLAAGCSNSPAPAAGDKGASSPKAAAYPTKAVSIVVPFSAGDISDLATRAFSEFAGGALGQSVVVVNKEGGGGSVGHAEVSKATADGYTLLTGSSGAMGIKPYTANVGYTPDDFKPIGQLVELPFSIISNKNAAFKTLKEFIEYAKNNPGKVKYASPGPGTSNHIVMETLAKKYGLKLVHVPYSGANDAVSVVLGGHVDAAIVVASQVVPQQKAGEVNVLGVTSPKKYEFMPDVPTFGEQGYELDASVWFGIFAPKNTPDDITKVLIDTMKKSSEDPKLKETWKKLSITPSYIGPDELKAKIAKESKSNLEIIKELGLEKK